MFVLVVPFVHAFSPEGNGPRLPLFVSAPKRDPQDSAGQTVKVPSADTEVIDSKTGNTVNTKSAKPRLAIDSRLPDEVWHEMKYVEFSSESGGFLNLFVEGVVRNVAADDLHMPLHGSRVVIHTAIGKIEVDGPIVTFEESSSGAFAAAGFAVADGRRRLKSGTQLMGIFDAIPAFENWPTKYDAPPHIPETFHAEKETLHSCEHQGQDLCTFYGVPATHIVDEFGQPATNKNKTQKALARDELYARVTSEVWNDAASNNHMELFEDLPHFQGWTFEKHRSETDGHMDIAQKWRATGERYFCRTEAGGTAPKLDGGKYASSYLGQIEFEGSPAAQFIIKHKESTEMTITLTTTIPDESGGVVSVLPKQIKIVYSKPAPVGGAPKGWKAMARNFITNYKSFKVDSFSDSIFSWGATPFEDTTVCAATVDYTPDASKPHHGNDFPIPAEAMIKGVSPMHPFFSAPDSTVFYHALQDVPSTTAAEWAATNKSQIRLITHTSIKNKAIQSGRLSSAHQTEHEYLDSMAHQRGRSLGVFGQQIPEAGDLRRRMEEKPERFQIDSISGRALKDKAHSPPLKVSSERRALSSSSHKAPLPPNHFENGRRLTGNCPCYMCSGDFCPVGDPCGMCSASAADSGCPDNKWGCFTTAASACNCDTASLDQQTEAGMSAQELTNAKQKAPVDGDGVIVSAANCNLNSQTDGNCPDSCRTSLSKWIEPVDLPCDVTVSSPHACEISIGCTSSIDAFYPSPVGPIKFGVGGSITLDCTTDWSRCDIIGCVDLDVGLSIRGAPEEIDLATLSACYSYRPLPCGYQKMFELSASLNLALITVTGTIDIFERYPQSCMTGLWGIGADGTPKTVRVLTVVTLTPPWPFNDVDLYNGYLIGA